MKKRELQPSTLLNFFPNISLPLIFAHRGCSAAFPENTIVAFEAALKNKVAAVELDVHLTKDNQLVIIHDKNCLRTTAKNYKIARTPYSLLRQCNAATTFNQNGSTNCKVKALIKKPSKEIVTPIPTLEELFALSKNAFIYDIEVKVNKKIKTTLNLINNLVQKYALSDNIILSSFNPITVRLARKFNFKATALIYGEEEEHFPKYIAKLLRLAKKKIARPIMLKPRRDHAIKEHEKELRLLSRGKQNRVIATWTVDDEKEAKQLIEHGIFGICTNHPEDLLK